MMNVYIQRYTDRERMNHWVVAIAFVLAALSGLALFPPGLVLLHQPVRRRHLDAHPASLRRRADVLSLRAHGGALLARQPL